MKQKEKKTRTRQTRRERKKGKEKGRGWVTETKSFKIRLEKTACNLKKNGRKCRKYGKRTTHHFYKIFT